MVGKLSLDAVTRARFLQFENLNYFIWRCKKTKKEKKKNEGVLGVFNDAMEKVSTFRFLMSSVVLATSVLRHIGK